MKPEDFIPLGLNLNEAKVYHALILNGSATASELIKELSFHRNIVYDNLEKLKEKGIVSFITQQGRRIYTAQDPQTLVEYLEQEQQKTQEKIQLAKELTPAIKQALGTQEKQSNVELFHGVQGVKRVLNMTIESQSKDQYIIGVSNESVDVLGTTYWDNYNRKLQAHEKIQWILKNEEYNDSTIMTSIWNKHIRILPKEASQIVEVILFDNKVAIFVYTQNPSVLLIEDENIYKTYKAQFDFYWKEAKPLQAKKLKK